MRVRSISALCLVAATGCRSNELSGTRWSVVEFAEPDAEDQRVISEVDAMLVEFRPDGRLVTTTVYKDGRATMEDRERYEVKGECLKIHCAQGTKAAMYRREGEQLRVHSPRFVMVLNPVRSAEEQRVIEVKHHEN